MESKNFVTLHHYYCMKISLASSIIIHFYGELYTSLSVFLPMLYNFVALLILLVTYLNPSCPTRG